MKKVKTSKKEKETKTKNKIDLKDKVIKAKDDLKKKAKKVKKKKYWLLTIFMGLLIALFGMVVLFALYIIIFSPEFNEDNLYNKEATILYDKDGVEFAKIGLEKRDLVTYDELPQVLIDAIVATEDSRFFQHNGFDIARFAKASIGQLTGDSGAGGASTLSMQVVKNSFTDANQVSGIKGITRKFTDIYMAVFKLEKNYTKEQIIEFYVNSPWLGNGTYGVEQACQTYFGKSVSEISLTEAAIIAGMFQAPASYNPFNSIDLTTQRRNQVLNLMVKHGYITEEQAEDAKSIKVASLLTEQKNTSQWQPLIDTVVAEIEDDTGYDAYSVPMQIYTTFDLERQEVVNGIMTGETYEFVNDVVQMGIAITDVRDGSIVAIGNGRNRVGEKQYNYATNINRHPGSTAKPFFDYGPLIEYNDASTYTPFFDEKWTYSNGTSIHNSDRKYLGLITMRYALARSRNIPALQAFQQVDKENIRTFVEACGIDYGEDFYESASIGGFNGMSPMSMSAAYATFARNGYYIEPYSYTKVIITETGEEIEQKPKKEEAMSGSTATMINYMLEYAIDNGILGTINVSGTDIAGKTGTSSIDKNATKKYGIPSYAIMDSWASIYSPDYSISIWYGYDELSSDYYLTSSKANKVRSAVSKQLAKGIFKKNSQFKQASGVVKVTVEKETFPAQMASPHTPKDLQTVELFKKGTEPTEVSDRFNTLADPTNLKATYENGVATITWDAIKTPNAIDPAWLQEHFNTYYDKWASKYYQQRINYNNAHIGTIGYQLYLKNTTTGELIPLTWTTNNSYSYSVTNTSSKQTIVVKSAYSIFKNNMSNGVEVSFNPVELSNVVTFSMIEDPSNVSKTEKLEYYTDLQKPFKLLVNGVETTDYTFTSKYYEIIGTTETEVSSIPLNKEGTYKILYTVIYGEKKYNPSRKVIVK